MFITYETRVSLFRHAVTVAKRNGKETNNLHPLDLQLEQEAT